MANIEEIAQLEAIYNLELAENHANTESRTLQRYDAFNLSELQFQKLFRLSKELARNLIHEVDSYIETPSRISALDSTTKVLTALRFYASGSYQTDIGLNVYTAISQPSVSRCIREISTIVARPEFYNSWVKFPGTMDGLKATRNEFYQKCNFPGVVSCIDCTHIAIVASRIDEHIYVNKKGYHSLNVQLTCDANLKILHASVRYPGSTHDSYVWNNSNLKDYFVSLHNREHTSFFLLGDSGYALRSYMLTPLTNPEPLPSTSEYRYNQTHRSTRSLIERCNGVLKMRFRCLLKHRVLNYDPETAAKITQSCIELHNMCIAEQIPEPEYEEFDEVDFGMIPNNREGDPVLRRVNPELTKGREMQRAIINRYFE